MAFQLILNTIIAFVWLFLKSSWNGQQFIVGYALGLLLIWTLRRFFKRPFYLVKLWAAIRLFAILLKELLRSSLTVIGHVIRPSLQISPGIFIYKTKLESDWEITLLSLMISLTPGSLLVEVGPDRKSLYIHAMNLDKEDIMCQQIRNTFEKAIQEVTR